MKLGTRLAHLRTVFTGRHPFQGDAMRFAGGLSSRLVSNWFAVLDEANQEIRWSLVELRARSRQLVRDHGEAEGLLKDFESDIAGPAGAQLQFRARLPRGKPIDTLNERVEQKFRRWTKRGACTIGPAMSFAALQRLMIRTVIQDGEFLALRVRDPRLRSGYALQLLDADQLDESENRNLGVDGQNAIIMGVEVNAVGRPVAYHIWDRHPSLPGRTKQRVPANEVLHVFKTVRPGQLRGVPWMAPVLIPWKMGSRYTEAELYQSLLAASQSGFFVDKQGTANLDMPKVDGKPRALQLELAPGMARQLPSGLEFQPWEPKHPTANFSGFMKVISRLKARAFGRSYASLTGDLSDVNFSSMRIDREREKAQNRVHQQELLVEQFCEVVFGDWVQMATVVGELGVVTFDAESLTEFASWMTIGWPWIDPVKDATAAQMQLNMGTTSPQRLCAEMGRDYFDVIDEIAEARDYAKEKNVNLEAVPLAITIATDMADPPAPSTDNQSGRVIPLRTGTA